MNSQLARHFSSPERPTGGQVEPPAPGQAYFGYPQPSQVPFPVPKQTPAATEKRRPATMSGARPYRAHSKRTGSGMSLHLVGYPLAVVLAGLVGATAVHATSASGHHGTPAATAATIPGSGTFAVGTNVQPGQYATSAGQSTCYWARLKATTDGRNVIIASGTTATQAKVTIKKSDAAFETSGCGTWTRA